MEHDDEDEDEDEGGDEEARAARYLVHGAGQAAAWRAQLLLQGEGVDGGGGGGDASPPPTR